MAFDARLNEQEFISISTQIAQQTPCVPHITFTGASVLLEVRSNSGLSTWPTKIDFNDFGRLSGNYWLTSTNTQSPIPEFFAHAVQEEIWNRIGRNASGGVKDSLI